MTIKIAHSTFVKALQFVCNDLTAVDVDSGDPVCLPAPAIVDGLRETFGETLPESRDTELALIVSAAIRNGEVPGFMTRRGRDGGAYATGAKHDVARPKGTLRLAHASLTKAIRNELVTLCTVDEDGKPVCAPAPTVVEALRATHGEALPESRDTELALIVNAAARNGEITGYLTRRGRNGGIYRVQGAKAIRRAAARTAGKAANG